MLTSLIIGFRAGDWTRRRNLQSCLEAMHAQAKKFDEVIVVEQDTESRIGARLKETLSGDTPTVHLFDEYGEAYNRGLAFNRGVDYADHELLCLCDADLWFPSGWAGGVRQLFERETASAVLPYDTVLYLGEAGTDVFLKGNCVPLPSAVERRSFTAHGGVLWITRRLFYELGGYDEDFVGWGGEDDEFYHRMMGATEVYRMHDELIHLWHPKAERGDVAARNAELYRARIDIAVEQVKAVNRT